MPQDSTSNTTGVHYDYFAGERRRFFLPIFGELRQLQEKHDIGPMIFERAFRENFWKVEYIVDVIKYGLIGGGMKEAEADKLVIDTIEAGRILRYVGLAHNIMIVTLGPLEDEEDDAGKKPAPQDEEETADEVSA